MSDRPIQLMLVDEDPVFRLGLKVWLEQQGDFTVVSEAGSAADALAEVRSRFDRYQQSLDDPSLRNKDGPPTPPIDLVLLDLGMGAKEPNSMPGLTLCQQLKQAFPNLPVLVLSAQAEPVLQAAAERMGANAYGTRSMSVRRLAQLIRQTSAGISTSAEGRDRDAMAQSDVGPGGGSQSVQSNAQPSAQPNSSFGQDRTASLSRLNDIPGPLTAMRISMRLSGVRQINQSLSDVEKARQQTASWLNQAVLAGKKRELIAARWLMSALWRTPRFESGAAEAQLVGAGAGRAG
ncbi:MAG: response regulator transcription factor, partial [Cyanobacteria bacterium J06607_13]